VNVFHWAFIVIYFLVAVTTAGHALLHKRDPRAALGWIAVCFTFPLAGPLLYFLFGINRIRTRAKKLEQRSPFQVTSGYPDSEDESEHILTNHHFSAEVKEISQISNAITRWPLLCGNQVEALHNGEQAYPAMIEAIESARNWIYLASFIFETNRTGRRFIRALAEAAKRGVDVKVIVDGIGELYSYPRASTLLQKHGVRAARFLPPRLIPPTININLRNHRKILAVDGRICFVGGMNIGDRHLAQNLENPSRVIDMHLRVQGPLVAQIEQVFLDDWLFTTGEEVLGHSSPTITAGEAICRTIVEGPNEDFDKLATILVGVVSSARRRLSVMTPYFLPSRELIGALKTAALRGVEVDVILPAKNNIPFVHWATRNMLWELLEKGIRIHYQPPPFVHSKLLLVDEAYAQMGSANIDPRSLRLNFELVIEIYSKPFAESLGMYVRDVIMRSREITLDDLDRRPLRVKTRDALAWLFSPYL
jgi:cardiolipin synthase